MERTVWQYKLTGDKNQKLRIPEGGEILTVQAIGGNLFLFVLSEIGKGNIEREFEIYGSRELIETNGGGLAKKYIGTCNFGNETHSVFHIFEVFRN